VTGTDRGPFHPCKPSRQGGQGRLSRKKYAAPFFPGALEGPDQRVARNHGPVGSDQQPLGSFTAHRFWAEPDASGWVCWGGSPAPGVGGVTRWVILPRSPGCLRGSVTDRSSRLMAWWRRSVLRVDALSWSVLGVERGTRWARVGTWVSRNPKRRDGDGADQASAEPSVDGTGRTFGQRLDHLFKTVHPAERGEYSYHEVVAGIAARGGPTISASYVWQLRKGQRDNPTHRHIAALSEFFSVPPAYFFDDVLARQVDRDLEVRMALKNAGVRRMAFRSAGLPEEDVDAVMDAVMGMIEQFRVARGLDKGGGEKG
jgi:hypothetical protein